MNKKYVGAGLLLVVGAFVVMTSLFANSAKKLKSEVVGAQGRFVTNYQRLADLVPAFGKNLRTYKLTPKELAEVEKWEGLHKEKLKSLVLEEVPNYVQFDKNMAALNAALPPLIQMGISKKTPLQNREFQDLEKLYAQLKQEVTDSRQKLFLANQKYNLKLETTSGKIFGKVLGLKQEPFFNPINSFTGSL